MCGFVNTAGFSKAWRCVWHACGCCSTRPSVTGCRYSLRRRRNGAATVANPDWPWPVRVAAPLAAPLHAAIRVSLALFTPVGAPCALYRCPVANLFRKVGLTFRNVSGMFQECVRNAFRKVCSFQGKFTFRNVSGMTFRNVSGMFQECFRNAELCGSAFPISGHSKGSVGIPRDPWSAWGVRHAGVRHPGVRHPPLRLRGDFLKTGLVVPGVHKVFWCARYVPQHPCGAAVRQRSWGFMLWCVSRFRRRAALRILTAARARMTIFS